MAKPFYNSTEADLASGSLNAVSIIAPVPADYGVSADLIASYSPMATNFNALYALAVAPATRTSVVVSKKNAAKKLLIAASVDLARTVTATQSVTNSMLLALQMNERVAPKPRNVPQTAPTVEVISVIGRLVKVRVHDSGSDRRGLPFGAIGAHLYSCVAPVPTNDPRDYHFEGMTSRATMNIQFPDSVPSGSTVWLSASWVSARGQTSIASVPINFTLQGGAISAAA